MNFDKRPYRSSLPEWITWELVLSELSVAAREGVAKFKIAYVDHSDDTLYVSFELDSAEDSDLPLLYKARDELMDVTGAQFIRATELIEYAKKREFLRGKKWRIARYATLMQQGNWCRCCGRRPPDVILNVDHIQPRSLRPDLAYDFNNLQVLCDDCNAGKGNTDSTDWRNPAAKPAAG